MCERGEITFRQGGPGGRRPGVATAYSLEYLEGGFSKVRGQGGLRSSVFSKISRVLDEGLKLAPATAYSRRPRTHRRQLVEAGEFRQRLSIVDAKKGNTTHIDHTPCRGSTGLRIDIPSAARYSVAMYTRIRVR